eukprot:TRINITY_DN20777_c0_g1_i1.p1 TRINITY_DN20777_c0_g1~~TRINITY_DN20777_c0_g1_i1.p1  ORF type:complete len:688 (+),score=69.95 TRINITY_DN20777_c0_g1_i1:455-2518(+)
MSQSGNKENKELNNSTGTTTNANKICKRGGGPKQRLPAPVSAFAHQENHPHNQSSDSVTYTVNAQPRSPAHLMRVASSDSGSAKAQVQTDGKVQRRSTLVAEAQKLKHQETESLKTKKRRFIVLPDSIFRTMWDTVWVGLYVTECLLVSVPICASGAPEPDSLEKVIMCLATLFFLSTIALNFRTAILDGWTLIDDSVQNIASRYVRSGCVVFDAFVAFPFDLLCLRTSTKAYRILSLMRTFKILRFKLGSIGQPFSKSNPLVEDTAYSETIKISFTFLMSVHIIASMCLLIISNDEGSFTGVYLTKPEAERDMWHDYGYALYWTLVTMTTVGYGDVTPLTTSSRYFSTAVVVAGAGGYALVMGRISTVLVDRSHFEQHIREKKRALAQMMDHFSVPWELQKETFSLYPMILEAGLRVQSSQFLDDLPSFMRERVLKYVKYSLVKGVPLFNTLPAMICELLTDFLVQDIVEPGSWIIQTGEMGHEMYLLRHGLVEVLRVTDNEETPVAALSDGAWFGEIALLRETERNASVRAVTACEMFKLDKDDFLLIYKMYPTIMTAVTNEMEKRLTEVKPPRKEDNLWGGFFKCCMSEPADTEIDGPNDAPEANKTNHYLANNTCDIDRTDIQSVQTIPREENDNFDIMPQYTPLSASLPHGNPSCESLPGFNEQSPSGSPHVSSRLAPFGRK